MSAREQAEQSLQQESTRSSSGSSEPFPPNHDDESVHAKGSNVNGEQQPDTTVKTPTLKVTSQSNGRDPPEPISEPSRRGGFGNDGLPAPDHPVPVESGGPAEDLAGYTQPVRRKSADTAITPNTASCDAQGVQQQVAVARDSSLPSLNLARSPRRPSSFSLSSREFDKYLAPDSGSEQHDGRPAFPTERSPSAAEGASFSGASSIGCGVGDGRPEFGSERSERLDSRYFRTVASGSRAASSGFEEKYLREGSVSSRDSNLLERSGAEVSPLQPESEGNDQISGRADSDLLKSIQECDMPRLNSYLASEASSAGDAVFDQFLHSADGYHSS